MDVVSTAPQNILRYSRCLRKISGQAVAAHTFNSGSRGQSGLQSKSPANQGYTEKPCQGLLSTVRRGKGRGLVSRAFGKAGLCWLPACYFLLFVTAAQGKLINTVCLLAQTFQKQEPLQSSSEVRPQWERSYMQTVRTLSRLRGTELSELWDSVWR